MGSGGFAEAVNFFTTFNKMMLPRGHMLKALTGAAAQLVQSSQWQYPIAVGVPDTSNSTAPLKHLDYCSVGINIH